MSNEAFIYEAIRTPRGRGKQTGSLHATKPVSLVVGLIDEMRRRHPGLDPTEIDDMVLGVVSPGRRAGRGHRAHRGHHGRPAGHRGWRAAQQVLRVRPGGREHRGAEGPLRLGQPGARRWRRVDVAGADGFRRRRVGDGPGDQLRHVLRAAGHRRRPDRDHRGLLPRGRRRLRRAVPGTRRQGVVRRLLRQVRRAGHRPQRPARAGPRRAHAPRVHSGGTGQAGPVVRRRRRDGRLRRRRAAEVPLGREDQPRAHRGQLLRHRRRRRAGAGRQRAGRPGGAAWRPGRAWSPPRPPAPTRRSC